MKSATQIVRRNCRVQAIDAFVGLSGSVVCGLDMLAMRPPG